MADTTETSRYRVEGMDCPSCAAKIETALRRVPGITDVSVSVGAGSMTLRHTPAPGLDDAVARQMKALGYGVWPIPGGDRESAAPAADCDHGHDNHHDHSAGGGAHAHSHGADEPGVVWWRTAKARLAFAATAAVGAAWGLSQVWPSAAPWLFAGGMLVGLIPIAGRALAAARAGTPFSIEMLMTIAAIGAVIIGASQEAAVVVVLFLFGELLEGVAAGRARASIQSLTTLVPRTALLEENGETHEVPADSLTVGAVILVRPGERVSADGIVLSGESDVDEAPVTGESVPARKGPDAQVYAGTINGEAALRVRVATAASDNMIARIIRQVEEAQESKAPTERFIDRFSRYYTPGVVAVSALIVVVPPLLLGASWSAWLYKGLAILLIGCPCALVISTPAAIAAGLASGARRGLLMKGGAVLEQAGKITVAAFDKTGTLTVGRPVVTDVVAVSGSEAQALATAAALEAGSTHPLARAILAAAEAKGADAGSAADLKAVPGQGVEGRVGGQLAFLGSASAAGQRAQIDPAALQQIDALHGEGKTVSVLVIEDRLVAIIGLRDEPRPDAKAALTALSKQGVRAVMLTGDNRRAAEAIGQALGMEVHAELLPQDKQRIVRELMAGGAKVAKIGDGINDAPALAAADIGIAMGGGTDVALETADAAILHGRVADVAVLVTLSRRTMANIRQNVTIALGLKAVFLITTLVGLTGLWPAILADTGATVLVTLNALRLLGPVSR